jgi:hypothetical protein
MVILLQIHGTMRLEDLKKRLIHLKQLSCDDDTQKAIKAMLDALELESEWSEAELQEVAAQLDELAGELA